MSEKADLSLLLKLKKDKLKSRCKEKGLAVGGNKQDLALRLIGSRLLRDEATVSPSPISPPLPSNQQPDPLLLVHELKTPPDYIKATQRVQWNTDLRSLPLLNFSQVRYLVTFYRCIVTMSVCWYVPIQYKYNSLFRLGGEKQETLAKRLFCPSTKQRNKANNKRGMA
jgi:hypothetical protein